jgi:hypothetical protein
MSPRFSTDHFAYDRLTHAEHPTEARLREVTTAVETTNSQHVGVFQLGVLVALATQRVTATFPFSVGVVVALRASEQMCRVAARRIIATVQNAQRLIEFWVSEHVGESRCAPLSVIQFERAVAVIEEGAGPWPAHSKVIRFNNVRPERLRRIGLERHGGL